MPRRSADWLKTKCHMCNRVPNGEDRTVSDYTGLHYCWKIDCRKIYEERKKKGQVDMKPPWLSAARREGLLEREQAEQKRTVRRKAN